MDPSVAAPAAVGDPQRRISVIANRGSGSGKAAVDAVAEVFQTAGFAVQTAIADNLDAVLHLTDEAASRGDIVAIGGGDGTLSATLPILLRHKGRLGILPMGTANDLARSLDIPFDPVEAARVIAAGHTRSIDVGLVNGRPFFNVASIGIGTEVARRHTGERKRLLGILNYPLCWYQALRDHRPRRATLRCDGKERRHRFTMLAVGNGRYHGGGLMIDEDARHDDGLLSVYYLKSASAFDLLRALYSLRMGRLRKDKRATVLRCRTAEIDGCPPLPINVDGEILETTPATFGLLDKALTVFAPGPGADQGSGP